MKSISYLRPSILVGSIAAAAVLAVGLGRPSHATTLIWDGSNTLNAQADGGTGTWDSNVTSNWWNGTSDVVWPNSGTDNDALFGIAAGTVNIDAGGVTANDIGFTTTGYILSGASTLTLNGTTPTITVGAGISATIGNNTATVIDGLAGLTKAGAGTLTLSGSAVNTVTGGLTVNGGTLALNLTNLAAPTDIIGSGNALTLGGGGTLQTLGKTAAVTSQTFSGTTANSGANTVRVSQNASTSNTLNLGTVSHTAGGVLNFVAGSTTIVNSVNSTTEIMRVSNATNALIGSWAFVNDSTTNTARWANVTGTGQVGTIAGITATGNMANVASATTVYTATGTFTVLSPRTAFGLQATGNSSYVLGSQSLTTMGLLSINAGTTIGVTGTTGIIVGSGNELVIAGAGNVTISTPIANKSGDNSHVTYAGGGTLTLDTAASTYTGLTTVNSGTVALGLANVLNSASGIVVNGGALGISSFDQSVASVKLSGGTITGSTGTLASASAFDVRNGTVAAILAGNSGLNKTTAGTVTLSAANTYTGLTSINAGRLDLTGSLTSNISVNAGATLGGEGSTTGSVVFNGASTLSFDPNTPAYLSANTVNATGGSVTIVPATSVGGIGIVVLEALGGITGTPGTNFVFNGRGMAYLGAGNTRLLFDFTPGAVTWRGNDPANPTYWDVNVTSNWLNGAAPDKFLSGDAVTFDDTANSFTVAIQGSSLQAGAVTFNNTANTYTLQGGGISGPASVVKNGTATVIVNNSNTYTGTTTINAGTIQLGDGTNSTASLGTGAITNNAAIVASFGTNNGSIVADIGGTGTITKTGAGNVSLSGTNTYSGLTTVNGGTLQIGAGGITGSLGTGSVTLANNATLAFNRSDIITVMNPIGGQGGLLKIGGARLTLGTSNTYTGLTTISAGSILVTAPSGVLGDTTSGTVVNPGAALLLQGTIVVSGESLSLAGEGPLAAGAFRSIGGNNEWAGNITVQAAGITRVAADAGTSLKISGNVSLSPTASDQFVLMGDGSGEISGVISGLGRLTKSATGASTWVLSGANTYTGRTTISNGFLSVASINSVLGGTPSSNLGAPTSVANGTLDLGGTGVTGGLLYTGTGETTDRVINLSGATNGGIIDQSGTGLLKFTSNLTAIAGAKTLTLQGSTGGTGEFAGNLGNGLGVVSVRKAGTGKWTLSGANSYTGVTNITNGTLAVDATGSISGTTSINISGAATFDVNALPGGFMLGSTQSITGGAGAVPGAIAGTLIADAGSIVAPGLGAGVTGTLSVSNGFSLLSTAHLAIDLAGSAAGVGYDQLIVNAGNISLAGDLAGSALAFTPTNFADVFFIIVNSGGGTTTGTLNGVAEGGSIVIGAQEFQISYTSDFGGAGFTINGSGNDVALLAVPEPGSVASLLGGLGLVLGLRRRR
jgi:fibronectin-binding autotransporter adhesin